jgi:hypothetical protein
MQTNSNVMTRAIIAKGARGHNGIAARALIALGDDCSIGYHGAAY